MRKLYDSSIKVFVGIMTVGEKIEKDNKTVILVDRENEEYKIPIPMGISRGIKNGDQLGCAYEYQQSNINVKQLLLIKNMKTNEELFSASNQWQLYFKMCMKENKLKPSSNKRV